MKKMATGFLLLLLFSLLLLFPEEVKTGAQSGLFLWYNSVVPILLPFLILSGVIIGTDSLSLFLQPLSSLLTNKLNLALDSKYLIVLLIKLLSLILFL